jgi:hypothetical protein
MKMVKDKEKLEVKIWHEYRITEGKATRKYNAKVSCQNSNTVDICETLDQLATGLYMHIQSFYYIDAGCDICNATISIDTIDQPPAISLQANRDDKGEIVASGSYIRKLTDKEMQTLCEKLYQEISMYITEKKLD